MLREEFQRHGIPHAYALTYVTQGPDAAYVLHCESWHMAVAAALDRWERRKLLAKQWGRHSQTHG